MRLHPIAIIGFLFFVGGCAARQSIDVQSLHGPVADVVAANHLERYDAWPIMNLSVDDDGGTTYFLESGDLTIRDSGQPPTVTSVEFRPSQKSAKERFQEANAGWNDWVKAHSGSAGPVEKGAMPEPPSAPGRVP